MPEKSDKAFTPINKPLSLRKIRMGNCRLQTMLNLRLMRVPDEMVQISDPEIYEWFFGATGTMQEAE